MPERQGFDEDTKLRAPTYKNTRGHYFIFNYLQVGSRSTYALKRLEVLLVY